MTIEYREHDGRGDTTVMTECPWCDAEFEEGSRDRVNHFMNEHGDEI